MFRKQSDCGTRLLGFEVLVTVVLERFFVEWSAIAIDSLNCLNLYKDRNVVG